VRTENYLLGFEPVEDEPDGVEDDPLLDPLGADDDPLGADDDPLGADEDDPLGAEEPDEDDPLGDAAGLDDVSAFAWTPSFAAVSPSRRPVAFSPSFC
jgi:hypothetical protein